MSTDADVVVVGAGIVGCQVAGAVLDRVPGARVAVLDRGGAGDGASRWSAGLHFARGASERVRAMSAFSARYYDALRRRDPAAPIHPLRMTVVGGSSVDEQYLPEANLAPVPAVPGGLAIVPAGCRAWAGNGAHYADVGRLTQLLAAGLRPRARVWEGTAVTAVEPGGSDVVLKLGTGSTLTAGRVVLTPGPWVADPAWRELLEPLGLRVKKVVALHVERPPGPADPVVVFHDEDAFLLPLAGRGHWLFSYTSPDWDVSPDALSGGLSATDLDRGRAILERYAPDLAGVTVSGRVFCDAYSPDRAPVVRAVADRVVFAGAANGSGYRLAPAMAAEAADLLLSDGGTP